MRPKKIDQTNIKDHYYLNLDDKCYYFFDYSIGKEVTYSPGNQLILNLKKSPLKKNKPEWKYKETAIETIAKMILGAFGKHLVSHFITAIPSSKSKEKPEYDDRILKIIQRIKHLAINEGIELNVGEILELTSSPQ